MVRRRKVRSIDAPLHPGIALDVARSLRIGEGNDTHRLVEGADLVIGGVHIEHEKGVVGHSDADVLSHAIVDALLGAMRRDDIGVHFPPDDPQWRGVSSLTFLEETAKMMSAGGFEVVNIDSTIMAQRPMLRPYINLMTIAIAHMLGIDQRRVSIKAKTGEGVGPVGREEAIEAHAIALLLKIGNQQT